MTFSGIKTLLNPTQAFPTDEELQQVIQSVHDQGGKSQYRNENLIYKEW